ncbi:hypothetical protein ABZY58_11250 [Micromonospora tulbaghiae]
MPAEVRSIAAQRDRDQRTTDEANAAEVERIRRDLDTPTSRQHKQQNNRR